MHPSAPEIVLAAEKTSCDWAVPGQGQGHGEGKRKEVCLVKRHDDQMDGNR